MRTYLKCAAGPHYELFNKDAEDSNVVREGAEAFRENLERQAEACGIYHKKLVKHITTVAANLTTRKVRVFAPGMLVCVWRKGVRQQEHVRQQEMFLAHGVFAALYRDVPCPGLR